MSTSSTPRQPSASAGFADHFSAQAHSYRRYRPGYPDELFAWLAKESPARDAVWDCATGSGQAAVTLARYFETVYATDASAAQISRAMPGPGVRYSVARADASGLATDSVDLVTVAQSLHWLDSNTFYAEVRRVGRPGALVAAWSYGLIDAGPHLNPIIRNLYTEILGAYWPEERKHVDEGYSGIHFPFPRLSPPKIEMEAQWGLARLTGYLETWSAVGRFKEAEGRDPVLMVQDDLADAWGDPGRGHLMRWPLYLLAGHIDG